MEKKKEEEIENESIAKRKYGTKLQNRNSIVIIWKQIIEPHSNNGDAQNR